MKKKWANPFWHFDTEQLNTIDREKTNYSYTFNMYDVLWKKTFRKIIFIKSLKYASNTMYYLKKILLR